MKILQTIVFPVALSIGLGILVSCSGEKTEQNQTSFTKLDSLTDTYLSMQDTLVTVWNTMINDDNHKIKVMHSLLHELNVCGQFDAETLGGLQHRLDQLPGIRFTNLTMQNPDVVEEYDFASSSLITELITLAEAHKGYAYNKALQHMVEEIQEADLRVENYRLDYDALATRYNQFLEMNRSQLAEITENGKITKKPLFQIAAE
jgi:hypothetical protein